VFPVPPPVRRTVLALDAMDQTDPQGGGQTVSLQLGVFPAPALDIAGSAPDLSFHTPTSGLYRNAPDFGFEDLGPASPDIRSTITTNTVSSCVVAVSGTSTVSVCSAPIMSQGSTGLFSSTNLYGASHFARVPDERSVFFGVYDVTSPKKGDSVPSVPSLGFDRVNVRGSTQAQTVQDPDAQGRVEQFWGPGFHTPVNVSPAHSHRKRHYSSSSSESRVFFPRQKTVSFTRSNRLL
jgi:hypothetical protein